MSLASLQLFEEPAHDVAERLLGLMDRRSDSPTFGCFDRSYWHYRTTDFPSAWFNNAVEYAALLASSGKQPWLSPTLCDWAKGAVEFSLSLQQADGSVSEAYPHEHGFCATAFLCAHTAAAMLLLRLPFDARLGKMGGFLASDPRDVPANQIATAALALVRLAALSGEPRWKAEAERMLKRLAGVQAQDGGFSEHGGVDVGYQTVTLSALAQIAAGGQLNPDKDMVQRAIAFLAARVRDDGSFDYKATSRRTQFLFPFGIAYYRSEILDRLFKGLASRKMLRPSWLDDRYVADLATDYLRTARWAEAA